MTDHSFESVPSLLKVREFKTILAPQGQITGCLAKGVATEYLATQRQDNRIFDLGHSYQVF